MNVRTRSIALAFVPFLLLVVLLSACGGDEGGGGSTSQDPKALEGKSWILTEYIAADGSTQIIDIGVSATFDGTTISGSSGCNTYRGGYEATGNQIAISDLASTMMACADDVMAIEQRYLELLRGATTYKVSGRSMSMADADGTYVLQFQEG